MDKSNRGSLQLIWSHSHYDVCRNEQGFAGFRDEWVTAYNQGNGGPHSEFSDYMPISGNSNGTISTARSQDTAPVAGYPERITKRPKLSNLDSAFKTGAGVVTDPTTIGDELVGAISAANAAADGSVAETAGTYQQEAQMRGNVHCFMHPSGNNIETLERSSTVVELEAKGLKLAREVDYPSYQRQQIPGMRGAQLTLKKIELQFSKKEHNVEWVDVDLGNLIGRGSESLSTHLHNNATSNVIRVFSDGESRREAHLYNMYIGEAQDAQPEIGIRAISYWPRHGMPCFGMAPGNDVYLTGGGSEYLRGQYRERMPIASAATAYNAATATTAAASRGNQSFPQWIDGRSNGGGTNGVLLRANILLERVST